MRERASGQITLVGDEAVDNTIPADVLAQTLQRLQKLVLIAAAARERVGLRRRFKPTAELREKHVLRCAIPVAGSYAIPIAEVDARPQDDLPSLSDGSGLDDLYSVVGAVASGDVDSIRDLVPDRGLRSLMLRTLHDMAPSEGATWVLDFSARGQTAKRLNYSTRRSISRLLVQDQSIEEQGSVIGELQRIFLDSRRITIRHPATGALIDCSYEDDVESDIWESRRDFVQVTGQVSRTPEGHVSAVADVTAIERVDLSPFSVASIDIQGESFVVDPPLVVVPSLDDETGQYFVFDDHELGLHLAAGTRADLFDEVISELDFCYRAYAEESEDRLTPAALQLKEKLMLRLRKGGSDAA